MNDQPTGLPEMLQERDEILDLTHEDLVRRYIAQPVRRFLTFGTGEAAEQTLVGNEELPFYGATILNPTAKTIFVGFQSGSAQGSPIFVPPYSGLTWPARHTQLSLAVSAADAGLEQGQVTALQLYVPPEPRVFVYNPSASALETVSAVFSQAEDVTVKNASVQVRPKNAGRRGLEIVNVGAAAARLMLGAAAEAKKGIWLSGNGGTWNGQLSQTLWAGSVFAICEVGETTLAVVEA